MIRLMHGAVAAGFGAADALISAKVTQLGPGGIPYPVYLEAAGILAGIAGDKVGIPADVRDPLLLGSLALAGSRLARVASKGALMAGPKAWGGVGGDLMADPGAGGAPAGAAQIPARPGVRFLPSRAVGGYLGPSLYSGAQEMAGVAG